MARYFKLIFKSFYIILVTRIFFLYSVKLGLFSLPSEPTYGNTASFEDTDWRTEKEPWGVGIKKISIQNQKKIALMLFIDLAMLEQETIKIILKMREI